jgi:hypothetical protein
MPSPDENNTQQFTNPTIFWTTRTNPFKPIVLLSEDAITTS